MAIRRVQPKILDSDLIYWDHKSSDKFYLSTRKMETLLETNSYRVYSNIGRDHTYEQARELAKECDKTNTYLDYSSSILIPLKAMVSVDTIFTLLDINLAWNKDTEKMETVGLFRLSSKALGIDIAYYRIPTKYFDIVRGENYNHDTDTKNTEIDLNKLF